MRRSPRCLSPGTAARARVRPPAHTRAAGVDSSGMKPPTIHPQRKRIYDTVKRIPRGRVATYGQIAALAGLRGHARQVGYALHALPERSGVPWHRVINAQGRISLPALDDGALVQRKLLEKEGVRFSRAGIIDLERFGWKPRRQT
jgi:methylated-DNA-protein-cysteine methyltransferase-like protein